MDDGACDCDAYANLPPRRLWHPAVTGASAALTISRNCLRFGPCPRRDSRRVGRIQPEACMKGLNQQKSDKKKPTKSLKEKRAEKQQKKSSKGR